MTHEAGLAIYIHWPFCVTKCPYCDFNSHVREGVDQTRWRAALLAELAREAALTAGMTVGSIFFGGGTPSLMPPATVAALIEAVADRWAIAPDLEITLEANPSSVEAAQFVDLRAAGVNRVSLGLQALDDDALRLLGRPHDLAEGLAALDQAQRRFDRVGFDLIYARPGQTFADWEAELARAIGFGAEHLSLYQLTIEPRTRFAELHRRGALILPDEDAATALWELTQALTAAAGLQGYEVSNHARPGAQSRHNLAYWTYGDYVGIGPGAHGRRHGVATARLKKPESWLAAVEARGAGMELEQPLDAAARRTEALMMGLRLWAGVDLAALETRLGPLGLDPARLAELEALGLVAQEGNCLRVTPKGMPVLNAVTARLLT